MLFRSLWPGWREYKSDLRAVMFRKDNLIPAHRASRLSGEGQCLQQFPVRQIPTGQVVSAEMPGVLGLGVRADFHRDGFLQHRFRQDWVICRLLFSVNNTTQCRWPLNPFDSTLDDLPQFRLGCDCGGSWSLEDSTRADACPHRQHTAEWPKATSGALLFPTARRLFY